MLTFILQCAQSYAFRAPPRPLADEIWTEIKLFELVAAEGTRSPNFVRIHSSEERWNALFSTDRQPVIPSKKLYLSKSETVKLRSSLRRVALRTKFPHMRTAYTREPIPTHSSLKDADWLKKVPSRQVVFDIFTFWELLFFQKPQNFAGSREIPAKMKKSNNSLAVEDRQIMSIEHNYKLGVTPSESITENYVRRPEAEKSP